MNPNAWLVRRICPSPKLRLFCFSYAGGSAASYARWQAALGPEVEVCALQLPGRGARMAEAPMDSLPAVVAAVARVIALQGTVPYACFGHSLGALLAFEVARYKQQHGLAPARQLFVSGSAAPAARTGLAKLHLLPDAELIDALRSYNGTPAELLANRELMSLVLPTVRADFSLVENYAYRPSLRLPSPLTVLAGRHDEHVEPHLLEGWRKETAGECRIEWFDGDHFFLDSQRDAVLECVATALEQLEGLDLECGAQRMAN